MVSPGPAKEGSPGQNVALQFALVAPRYSRTEKMFPLTEARRVTHRIREEFNHGNVVLATLSRLPESCHATSTGQ